MNITGKIVKIGETQVRKTFQFRDLVIETFGQYPQYVTLQFRKDKCNLLDHYKTDDEVVVGINIGGRKWLNPETSEIKYFNSIEGWKIQQYVAEVSSKDQAPDREDDLPF